LNSVPPTQRVNSGTIATQSPPGVGSSLASQVISSPVSWDGSSKFLISAAIKTLNMPEVPDDAAARAAESRRLALQTHDRRVALPAAIMPEPPAGHDDVRRYTSHHCEDLDDRDFAFERQPAGADPNRRHGWIENRHDRKPDPAGCRSKAKSR